MSKVAKRNSQLAFFFRECQSRVMLAFVNHRGDIKPCHVDGYVLAENDPETTVFFGECEREEFFSVPEGIIIFGEVQQRVRW
jgi:hypothetical protein